MTKPDTSAVRLGSGPRAMLVRPGVGAAGHIVQRSDTTSRRLVVAQASLILVEEGRKRVRWSGGTCIAGPGDAIALQAGEVVDIANTPGASGAYRALWICWSAELLERATTASPGVALQPRLSEPFRAAYARAFDSLTGSVPARIAVSRLREVLLWLAEGGFHFATQSKPSLVHEVRVLLASDPAKAWSMSAVARALATSVATLRRRLADDDTSFRALVQDVRMGHALALLQNTDEPVLQVALAAGYASASRFAGRFKSRFGYLPTDIRGHNRGRR